MTTEADYLNQYDARRFPSPLVTVDSVLFTVHQQALCVLLVERANQPQKGRWGLPGGFIDMAHDDSTRATALRKLTEKQAFRLRGWNSWTHFPGQIVTRVAGA